MTGNKVIEGGSYTEMNPKLGIGEMYYGVRRDGKYQGRPAVVVTVAGCNLQCGQPTGFEHKPQEELEPSADAEWVCDTMEDWREAESLYEASELISEWETRGWLELLSGGHAILSISGGEPMMDSRQDDLVDLFDSLSKRDDFDLPTIEVQTNGTFQPQRKLRSFVSWYTVSPKLKSSGHSEEERINGGAIHEFVDVCDWPSEDFGAEFQFVVADEKDLTEVTEIYHSYRIPSDSVSVVPVSEEVVKATKTVAKSNGFTYRKQMERDNNE